MRHSRRLLLPIVLAAAVLIVPPWAQDDPNAPMAEALGTKYSLGHAFILAPPAPGRAWDPRIYAPPPTVPVRVDRPQLGREVATVFLVGCAGVRARA